MMALLFNPKKSLGKKKNDDDSMNGVLWQFKVLAPGIQYFSSVNWETIVIVFFRFTLHNPIGIKPWFLL